MKEALNNYAPPADATGLADSQKRWKDPELAASARWTLRDVAQANRLLDAAGLARASDQVRAGPSGPLHYELHVVQGWTDWMAAAEIMRQNLAEVGVTATVKAADYNAWDDALRRGRFALSMGFGRRFDTTRLAGFPSRFRPYASAAPGGADTLPVLVEVKPR